MKLARPVELAQSSHPEPVVVVTAAATALAVAGGRGWGAGVVCLAVLCGQLFVGWTNDYVDRVQDSAAGRQDKPVAAGRIRPGTVRFAAFLALLGAVIFSLACGLLAGTAHLAAVALATAYNLRLKASLLSVIPYVAAFPLLLVFITLSLPHPRLPPVWALIAMALLAAAGHLAQVLPDIESDRRLGKLGLPQRLGSRATAVIAPALLVAAGGVVAGGAGLKSTVVGAALLLSGGLALAVLVRGLQGYGRQAFRLLLLSALADGVAFLAGRPLGAP